MNVICQSALPDGNMNISQSDLNACIAAVVTDYNKYYPVWPVLMMARSFPVSELQFSWDDSSALAMTSSLLDNSS